MEAKRAGAPGVDATIKGPWLFRSNNYDMVACMSNPPPASLTRRTAGQDLSQTEP